MPPLVQRGRTACLAQSAAIDFHRGDGELMGLVVFFCFLDLLEAVPSPLLRLHVARVGPIGITYVLCSYTYTLAAH